MILGIYPLRLKPQLYQQLFAASSIALGKLDKNAAIVIAKAVESSAFFRLYARLPRWSEQHRYEWY